MMRSAPGSDPHRLAEVAQTLASPLAFESAAAWSQAAQAETAETIGADMAFAQLPGAEFVSNTFSEEALALYPTFFPLLNEIGYFERVSQLGVVTRRNGYGPHYERMLQTAYVQEYLRSLRAFDSLALSVPPSLSERIDTHPEVPVQILVHMATPNRPFGEAHVAVAERLQPALVAGVALHRQLEAVRGDLYALVDTSGGACAVFSMDGRLLHLSRALRRQLEREPTRESLLDRIRQLARTALRSPVQAGSDQYTGIRGRYALSASRAHALRPLMMVAVEAPPIVTRLPSAAVLAARLELTLRQAEVARLLAERRTNQEIADALAISVHTARHHVEAVLARLEVPRGEVRRRVLELADGAPPSPARPAD